MEFKKIVNISNYYDFIKYIEPRVDTIGIVKKLDKNNYLIPFLQYCNDCELDCDQIYEMLIYEIDSYEDLYSILKNSGYIKEGIY